MPVPHSMFVHPTHFHTRTHTNTHTHISYIQHTRRAQVNVEDLQANVFFTGGFDEASKTIKLFWTVLTCLSPEQRSQVLAFVTGSNRVPLDGFEPPLCITRGEEGEQALPKSHTCFNQLVLPPCEWSLSGCDGGVAGSVSLCGYDVLWSFQPISYISLFFLLSFILILLLSRIHTSTHPHHTHTHTHTHTHSLFFSLIHIVS